MSGPDEQATKQREFILSLVRRVEKLEGERAEFEARCQKCEAEVGKLMFEVGAVCESILQRWRLVRADAMREAMKP